MKVLKVLSLCVVASFAMSQFAHAATPNTSFIDASSATKLTPGKSLPVVTIHAGKTHPAASPVSKKPLTGKKTKVKRNTTKLPKQKSDKARPSASKLSAKTPKESGEKSLLKPAKH